MVKGVTMKKKLKKVVSPEFWGYKLEEIKKRIKTVYKNRGFKVIRIKHSDSEPWKVYFGHESGPYNLTSVHLSHSTIRSLL